MSYVIKATLASTTHQEYGEATIPFPIPNEQYDETMELLKAAGMGDALAQDSRVSEVDSFCGVLDALKGTAVNVDELDYLAKRLDSFCDNEVEQFQAMAHKLELANVKDFISLTFCCQEATVISNFSELEQAGKAHRMNLNGGSMPTEEWSAVDGRKEALRLIQSGEGTVTPYGVVYDNGMVLEPVYDGRHFPGYYYDVPVLGMAVLSDEDKLLGLFCLPASEQQLQRQYLRTGADSRNVRLAVDVDELPAKVTESLDLERLSVGDLPDLNRLCQAIKPLSKADTEKLNAAALLADTSGISALCQLAENLDQFDFIPGVRTPEEYGRYMIQQSGHFDYDANLEGFYDYRLYGEQRIREDGGQFNEYGYISYHGTLTLGELTRDDQQYRQEQGPQMGGLT